MITKKGEENIMNTSKMDKFQEKLQKVLVPIADKLSN